MATAILALFYLIGIAGRVYAPWLEPTARIINSQPYLTVSENILIEWLEAFFWFIAFVLFVYAWFKSLRLPGRHWLILFAAVCFLAAGEELSWGQHLFNFEGVATVQELNKQQETNIHNINLARIIGLSEDHDLYPYLVNMTFVLNPIFTAGCIFLWLLLPWAVNRGLLRRIPGLSAYPLSSKQTALFFLGGLIIYALIDKLWFDVGELLELTLPLVAFLYAWDRLQAETYAQQT
ncbi:MAG: hypothetical protein MJA83_19685 [Gammaproteobacteria bacterium]|nr:hypothetical protein [Gammaproteobacteria bacterium]